MRRWSFCLDVLPSVASALALGEIAGRVREEPKRTLVQGLPAVSYPALCSVTASGLNRRPAAARSSASICIALRVTVSARNLFA